jgi:hypothetical protein
VAFVFYLALTLWFINQMAPGILGWRIEDARLVITVIVVSALAVNLLLMYPFARVERDDDPEGTPIVGG